MRAEHHTDEPMDTSWPQPLEELQHVIAASKGLEGYHVMRFRVYKEFATGGTQGMDVEVIDAGPWASRTRFTVRATRDDGYTASGNPCATLEEAMYILRMNPGLQ